MPEVKDEPARHPTPLPGDVPNMFLQIKNMLSGALAEIKLSIDSCVSAVRSHNERLGNVETRVTNIDARVTNLEQSRVGPPPDAQRARVHAALVELESAVVACRASGVSVPEIVDEGPRSTDAD